MKIKYLLLVLCSFALIGCASSKSKNAVGISEFEKASNDNGFVYLDNKGAYSDVNYIEDAKKAILDDIVIEFVMYKDEDSVKKVQDKQIESFRNIKNTATTEHKDEGKNYYKFWMVSNGYYMVSSKVDKTLVFCKTTLENKEKVEKLLETLNY